MSSQNNNHEVIIAGAGPAGASAAIHLASHGVRVLLLEQKKFPRPKLCGEFISPECLDHFEKLGVAHDMQLSLPADITETVFYSRRGKRIVVPSRWFGGIAAMGLSRAAMDDNLLNRAKAIGVDVQQEASVVDVIENDHGVSGVRFKTNSAEHERRAQIVIDATGRGRFLSRKLKRADSRPAKRSKLVAFKAHLTGTRGSITSCEIYSYPGGYGGLSTIENGLSNLCFIIQASDVIRSHSNLQTVLRERVMQNERARFTLETAQVNTGWLSVSLDSFGRQHPSPANGLLSIGDSAAFIDPFTGSGMLMALESGQLVSDVIVRHLDKSSVAALSADYVREYREKFDTRLRLCGLLRRVAFNPHLAQVLISACGMSDRFRNWLARSTRSTSSPYSTTSRLT
jgi:flavin-dependent dehydrogenase